MATTQTATRRDVLKSTGTVATVGIVGGTATKLTIDVAAAAEEPELTTDAFVPDEGAIQVTVEEFETDDEEEPVASDVVDIGSGESTYVVDGLDGEEQYYDFLVEMGTDGESPELESLHLQLPVDPEDFPLIDHTEDVDEARPSDVSVEFDEWTLRKFQPRLYFEDSETRQQHDGLYGVVFRSDSESSYVCCYWALVDQNSDRRWLSHGSDLGEHRPIYVFVDEETDEIDHVVYDAFQWHAADLSPGTAYFEAHRADDETHPTFEVVPDEHFYTRTTNSGTFTALESWPADRDLWIDHGIYENGSPDLIENPWAMRRENGSWRRGLVSRSFAGAGTWIAHTLGWYGAEQADDHR